MSKTNLTMIKKILPIYFIAFLIIAVVLFLFPINLFDGEIIYQSGLQQNKIKAPLSLSYFIGMGYDKADMVGVKSFYLLPIGYLMAILFLFALPALAAYRIYLSRKKNRKYEKN